MDKIKFIHDVLDVVMSINGGTSCRRGNGHPTAFFNYSGHVSCISVDIHEDGWVPDSRTTKNFYFHLDSILDTEESLQENLTELRAYAFYLKFKRRKKDDIHN